MKLLQMVNEQGLIGKSQSMGETKEGGTDDRHRRARRAKRSGTRSTKRGRASRTKAVAKEEASPGETKRAEAKPAAAAVVMEAKELLVAKVLLMAEGHERPEVMMRAKKLLVLEMIEVPESVVVELRVPKP